LKFHLFTLANSIDITAAKVSIVLRIDHASIVVEFLPVLWVSLFASFRILGEFVVIQEEEQEEVALQSSCLESTYLAASYPWPNWGLEDHRTFMTLALAYRTFIVNP
jgi:hypothetical protein